MKKNLVALNTEENAVTFELQKNFMEVLAGSSHKIRDRNKTLEVSCIATAFIINNIMTTFNIKSKRKEFIEDLSNLIWQIVEAHEERSIEQGVFFKNGEKIEEGKIH